MSTVEQKIDCPLCGNQALFINDPALLAGWQRSEPGESWQTILCEETCRTYQIKGLQLRQLLESTANDGRAILSNLSRKRSEDGSRLPLDEYAVSGLLATYPFALAALARFGLSNVVLNCASEIEYHKPLYIVDSNGQRFTLRIFGDDFDVNGIESELLWLKTLRKNADLRVPEAVASKNGSFVQQVSVEDSSKSRYCVLYRWVSGIRFSRIAKENRTEAMIENLGVLVATMHQQAEAFEPPDGFSRPQYGREEFRRDLDECLANQELSQEERTKMKEVGTKRLQLLKQLGSSCQVFGMCHNDLSAHNILFHDDEVGLVDFHECSWGYYLINIAQVLDRTLFSEERESFLRGYEQVRQLPDHFSEHLEIVRESQKVPRSNTDWWIWM